MPRVIGHVAHKVGAGNGVDTAPSVTSALFGNGKFSRKGVPGCGAPLAGVHQGVAQGAV